MYFKKDSTAEEFSAADFLMGNPMKLMNDKKYLSSVKVKACAGIASSRKKGILKKLCPLMASHKKGNLKNYALRWHHTRKVT